MATQRDPLNGPAAPAIRNIERLLVGHGAQKAAVPALQIWAAARVFLEVGPKLAKPVAVGKWLVEELESQGHRREARGLAEIWPDLSRPFIDNPEPEVFRAAIRALEKAQAKISAFPPNSDYARRFGTCAQATLQRLILDLRESGDSASRDPKPQGGAPKTGAYDFFVGALAFWWIATGKPPPPSKMHRALLELLFALGSNDDPAGTSFETFKNALADTKRWHEQEIRADDTPPNPHNAIEIKRSKKRKKGESSQG